MEYLIPTIANYPLYTGGDPWANRDRDMQSDSSSKDLLIVEDEKALCDLIADVLEIEGHKVRTASNGLDALRLIAERKPQLIFLDMMMPVMDGWEFLRELRNNPESRELPVVIMTAVYDLAALERRTDARTILSKPFDIDAVLDAVRQHALD